MYSRKKILTVSYPIFLGLLAQNIINVTDTAFLGHVGEVELGASAIGGLYYICFFTLAFGFSIGAQILMARRNGEQKYQDIGPVLSQGILFSVCMAAVLLFLSLMTARPMMGLMLSSDTILDASESFFDIRIWGLLFSFPNTMYRAFYVAVTRTKVLTLNAVVMAVINIVLDWMLIFGKCGLPQMGLEGAALASVAAEAGSLLFFAVYTGLTVDCRKYAVKYTLAMKWRTVRTILRVSSFMMLQQFLPLATWFVFFLAIEHLGQRELAIANVVRSIYILALIPIQALSTTANTLVSNVMGAGESSKVKVVIRNIAGLSFFISLCCSAIMVMFPEEILSIYTSDVSLMSEAVPSVAVIAAALIVASLSNVVFNGISGTGNARSALWLEISAQSVYALYILCVCWWLRWPVAACFTCELVYYGLLLTVSVIYLKKADWQHARI